MIDWSNLNSRLECSHFVDCKTISTYPRSRIMERTNEVIELLREIRDAQREQLAEYKTVTQRSIDLQQKAVNRADNIGKTYRIALAVSAVLIVGIVILIIYLMTFLPRR